MRAVVMAGGEGTRLRPLTTNVPKPLLPVVGEPIMAHLLRLLHRHGIAEAVVTVQYLAGSVRTYFGDGAEYGVALRYATESVPLGTAGSVKNAEQGLAGEPFLVVSGDALTDIDLSDLVAFHHKTGAVVTVALARKPNVVQFGNVITAEDGRIERFIEKPTWGQVFSDTVNTGIYVVDPQVLDLIEPDEVVDWSADVFPALLASGAPLYGYITDRYWEDVGTIDSYLTVQRDALNGLVDVHIAGFEMAPQVWLGEGAALDPSATVLAPCFIGPHSSIERDCVVGPNTVLGSNVMVRRGARVVGSLLDASVYVDAGCEVQSALIGRSTELRARVHVDQGAVVGDQCVLEEEVEIAAGVHVYPSKTIEAGAVVNDNVIWEGQAHRSLFGPRGVSGIVNLDITPEMVVRLAAAYATLLPKGSTVTVGRDHSRAARAMNRALAGSLTAAGLDVRDLRITPLPIARSDVARAADGGVYLRTTLGEPESLDLLVLDRTGSDLSVPDQQRLERILVRRDFRRAFPGEIGDIHTPHRTIDEYAVQIATSIDVSGVAEADLKVVVDTGLGAASLVLPRVISHLGISVLTVNNRLDEEHPTSTQRSYHAAMARLAELVSSSRSDLGVRFDPTGERLSLVDETGRPFDHGRALLVLLDLVAAERRGGVVGLPSHTTRVAQDVTAYHGVNVEWAGTSTASLSRVAQRPGLVFAGDGRGGFIVPEMGPNVDGIAAFVRLVGLVARTQLTLSAIDRRIPQAHMSRAQVPTPWSRRGAVMRTLVETAGSRVVDTAEGVRIGEPDGSWTLAVPDDTEPVIRLWVEAGSDQRAEELLAQWFAVIEAQVS
ncbi:MAG TPA: sugar phosphate nucleotidyltransferase [Candidatus Nanopelagicales bacterium]